MTTYTLKCSKCRTAQEYHEKAGHDLYESSELDGWDWQQERGWLCPKCVLAKVGRVAKRKIVFQASFI